MRLVGPQNVALLLGLLAALLLVGFGWVLDRRRRQAALTTVTTERDEAGRLAEARAIDLERFLGFSRALARSVDADGVTAAINDHLVALAGSSGVSVLLSQGGGWEVFAGDRSTADELLVRLKAADDALVGVLSDGSRTEPGDAGRSTADTSFPLRVVGETIGLLVIRRDRQSIEPARLRVLEAVAATLAVTVKNLQLFREIHETGQRDALTGCATRTHGVEVIDGELRRARRSQASVSLLMVDIDHLKDINARYGYSCGDAVLAMVGRRLRDALRRSDLKCRYGGEEFIVFLPETPLMGARRVAETLRRGISERPMPWNGDEITVTASIGVTQALPGEVNVDALIARAETAVCRAQEEGHNTVRVASDTLATLQKSQRAQE